MERAVVPPERPPRHVVVNDCASDGAPDAAVTAMRPDGGGGVGGGGVGGGKNGVGGGSSMDRDNKDHDADGNRRCRPCPRRVATAVGMMTMAGKRGGEATVKRLQGDDEVMEMRRQSDMAPAQANRLSSSARTGPRVQSCRWMLTLINLKPSAGLLEGILKLTVNFQTAFFPPRCASLKDIHDGALKERLGIVYVAVDVIRGMIAQNSVRDGVDNRAHLVPRVDLPHCKQ